MANYLELYKRFIVAQTSGGSRILKGTRAFLKALMYYFRNRRVTSVDYGAEYDVASRTYSCWTDKIGKYTDKIVDLSYLESTNEPIQILDLACGQGYVTQSILQRWKDTFEQEFHIDAVDISSEMLSCCRKKVMDPRVRLTKADGLQFLKNSNANFYNAIFFAWALPYFNHRRLIPLLYRVLKPEGLLYVISNCQGTLGDIQQVFLELIARHPKELSKVPDVSFNLPKDKSDLCSWFAKQGFAIIRSDEAEEKVFFDDPSELFQWLRQTGALAGTGKIFMDRKRMEGLIIDEIRKKKGKGDKYMVNYCFGWGIFKKRK